MSQALIEKIRAARAVRIEVRHMVFLARRPTIEDFSIASRTNVKDSELVAKYVTGWEGVRECDLFPGGADTLVPFDAKLLEEAMPDAPNLVTPIVMQLTRAVVDALNKSEEASKNSVAGSTQPPLSGGSPASSQSH